MKIRIVAAATAYAARRKRKEDEAARIQNYLQGKALLEAQLRQAEQNGASAEQIAALRQTASSKGLGAALAGLESLRTPPRWPPSVPRRRMP